MTCPCFAIFYPLFLIHESKSRQALAFTFHVSRNSDYESD